ncbi:putative ubiquitin [Phytophthora cinnamomi]|uniref:putative ubiquitin n=1 Tax=Phytophthora cinnamomi TaxID=4785 RepID=UPI003559E88B|nr:putative ubiquitin [Phytophthora cinnamomi]
MRGLAVAVPWKDVYAQGLQGIIEVRDSDVRALKEKGKKQPNGSNEMTVGDLVDVLNEKLKPIAHEDGGVRFVEAIYLYGTKLSRHRTLHSIVPAASDGCPRLVAKTHFACKANGDLVLSVLSITGELVSVCCVPSDSVDNLKPIIQDE